MNAVIESPILHIEINNSTRWRHLGLKAATDSRVPFLIVCHNLLELALLLSGASATVYSKHRALTQPSDKTGFILP